MQAEEQNHDLSSCFNTNNILRLHWAFPILQQKIFLYLILIDVIFLHQWWHLEVATQTGVGEGNVLVS